MTNITNLQQLTALKKHIIDHTGAGIYWLDKDGKYLGCNAYFAALAGLAHPEDIIGKTHLSLPWKAQTKSIQKYDSTVLINNLPLCTTEEWQIHSGDTHVFLINRAPLCIEQGQTIGIVATLIDISRESPTNSHQKNSKKQTSRQKKLALYTDMAKDSIHNITTETFISFIYDYFEKIIGCMPGNVYWLNKDSIFLGCNDNVAKMLGLSSRDDIIGMTHAETAQLTHWSEGQAESFERDDRAVITTGIPKINVEEPPITDVNGREIYFLTNRVPLRDSNNQQTIGIVGISIDITDRKKMEVELKRAKEAAELASHAKTEFLANISHDIRTPLSGIVGMAEILENEVATPIQKKHAHDLGQSGHELLNMLNEILDVVQADELTSNDLYLAPFSIRHLIQGIINLEHPSTMVKEIKLLSYIDPNIPPILICDHKKLYHVLLNLVGNAIKFTNIGQVEIKVTLLEQKNDEVILKFQVIDTGKGIPPELIDNIFERFFRVEPSYKGRDKGHGLGLHFAQSYTQLLGGEIAVASQVNVGSNFYFTLSMQIGKMDSCILMPEASSQEASPISTEIFEHTLQILVIEDNKIALNIVDLMLKQAKLSSTPVTNAEVALELATTQHFDFIFSDVGLPGMSGIEFAKQLRAFETEHGKPAVPIVGLTAHAEGKIRDECIAAGMNDITIKPLTLSTLKTIIYKYSGSSTK